MAVKTLLDRTLREQRVALLAALMRSARSLDDAEDALHAAALDALDRWAASPPRNPAAWLLTVARRRALDAQRAGAAADRFARRAPFEPELARDEAISAAADLEDLGALADDELRLLCACCDPALPGDAQLALTLKVALGLDIAAVARALSATEAAASQRILRAKRQLESSRDAREPLTDDDLRARLQPVLAVLSALLNEGQSPTRGAAIERDRLGDALRLARLVCELVPHHASALGLRSLACFTAARAPSRVGPEGEALFLDEQDRARWDRSLLREALVALHEARALDAADPYVLQATIAAEHCTAPRWDECDWAAIVAAYDALIARDRSAALSLNRAIALSMRDGAAAGLDALAGISGPIEASPWFFAARSMMRWRMGADREGALDDLRAAIARCGNDGERAGLERRLARYLAR